jgi:NADPH:quinone reductase-like Zn-dependent oxidoreductase
MKRTTQNTMQAAVIDRFGGLEELQVRQLPRPEVGPEEVLIQVETAGVGVWDPFERERGFAQLFGVQPRFPYVLGTDGAGTVAAMGKDVRGFQVGDRVYAVSLMNPKGGFYAEYAAVKEDNVSRVPRGLTTEQAGVMACDALTALHGLSKVLALKRGETLLVLGVS